jgi:signal transduction histidine kinase
VSWLRRHGLDLLIVLVAIETALEVALRDATREPGTPLWLAVPAATAMVLALLAHRRRPFAAPMALWLLAAAISFVDGSLVTQTVSVFVAGIGATFLLGQLEDPFQARIGLAVALAGAAIVVWNSPDHVAGDFVFTPAVFAIAWLGGYAVRERSVRAERAEERAEVAERERDAAARIAVAEERARIARELHDVVAHAVSVMVLQTGAARHRLPAAAEEEGRALEEVERTGRRALVEMRRLLGAMRSEGQDAELAPQPGLDTLESLLEGYRSAGLAVDLRLEGERRALPRALDLSAYRIIQEGLTNTLKHAHATRADVVVHYEPDGLRVDVRDDGRGMAASDGLGHGLVGVRERVKIYGGEMSAGSANGGGFVLSASLPIEPDGR